MSEIVSRRREGVDWEVCGDSVWRSEVSESFSVVRRVSWVVIVAASFSFSCGEDEVVEEEVDMLDREGEWRRRGEVCVAMSRWKSSVGSESAVSMSEASSSVLSLSWRRCFRIVLCGTGGMRLTVPSSFSFSFSRLWSAVLARSCRDEVRDWSMGCTRYLLAP